MHSLGRTLQEFSFGIVGENWPTSIQELRHVTTLQVGPLSLSTLPDHAFIHMPLVKLTFAETNLEAIPHVICRINQLRSLEFNTTNVVDFATMVPHCATGGHHYEGLHSLTLAGTDLYELPMNIFSSFPHLTSLRIYDLKDASSSNINNIQFPSNNKIRHLGLDSNNLVSIPRSITTLPHLQSLDLARNQIQCGCLMSWMLHWEGRQNVNITGECENYNMSIADFIDTKLKTFCH
ncbi:uncharacterized protein LOC128235013 [Mya arenaria]|uniref:uncharacterized protein LOC128235013 n=1 Tax=Mya arenaria TaxID=6604 RepID=UPI0022E1B1F9|nr:uncharacterized protein LOC128235013 [Mya arenaria]